MIMTVFAGIAQFERSLILSRTDEGRKAAMVRGVTFGRPKKMRPDQAELARQLVLEGKSISSVARTFNVHPATIYRCIEPNGSLRSEEHTSELQSLMRISYAVFCLKTNNNKPLVITYLLDSKSQHNHQPLTATNCYIH